MAIGTHRAEVVPVVLEKHPDADSLSIVTVWGFTVVARTEDWQGVTKAVYVQPDSILPDKPEYRFLKETSSVRKDRAHLAKLKEERAICPEEFERVEALIEAKIDKNTKYLRLSAKRLRGVWSMGMLLPIPKCVFCAAVASPEPCPEEGCLNHVQIGDDLAEFLGITHYDPEEAIDPATGSRRHTGADVGPPPPLPFVPKYDIESAYRYAAEVFEPGELVVVTEKIDGMNGRFAQTARLSSEPEGELGLGIEEKIWVGSRTEWRLQSGGSKWWGALDQNPWIKEWTQNHLDHTMYGEVYGSTPAPVHYGLNSGELRFRAFDIFNKTAWLDGEEFVHLSAAGAMSPEHIVPIIGVVPYDFEWLKKSADGPSLVPGANHLREGIVVRPIRERYNRKLGRVIAKFVSNAFLEKYR